MRRRYNYTKDVKKAKRTFKTPKAILRHVLELYNEDPATWITGSRERRRYGTGKSAFCLLGGIEHFAANEDAFHAATNELHKALPNGYWIIGYNDQKKTVRPIKQVLKKALA